MTAPAQATALADQADMMLGRLPAQPAGELPAEAEALVTELCDAARSSVPGGIPVGILWDALAPVVTRCLAARAPAAPDASALEAAREEVVRLRGEVEKANEGRKRADFYFDLVRRAVGASPETTRDDVTSMVDTLVDEKMMDHRLAAAREEGRASVVAALSAAASESAQAYARATSEASAADSQRRMWERAVALAAKVAK